MSLVDCLWAGIAETGLATQLSAASLRVEGLAQQQQQLPVHRPISVKRRGKRGTAACYSHSFQLCANKHTRDRAPDTLLSSFRRLDTHRTIINDQESILCLATNSFIFLFRIPCLPHVSMSVHIGESRVLVLAPITPGLPMDYDPLLRNNLSFS
jgi:hypothetical protein